MNPPDSSSLERERLGERDRRVLRFIDRAMPPELREGGTERRRKGRIITGFLLLMLAITVLSIPLTLATEEMRDNPAGYVVLAAEFVAYSGCLWLLWRTRNPALLGGVVSAALMVLFFAYDIADGGIRPPAMAWQLLVPLGALFFVGRRAALSLSGIIFAGWMAIAAARSAGAFPDPEGSVMEAWAYSILFSFLLAMVLGLAWVVDASRVDAQRSLERVMFQNQELALAQRAAEEASRAKSMFLATMSHELRTPLNAIIGYAEMLGEEFGDDEQQDEYAHDVERIEHAGRHLLELINDILDISKIEAGKLALSVQTFELQEILDRLVANVLEVARSNRNEIELRVQGPIGSMQTDAGRLEQLLGNLLDNAAKFTEDGQITFRAERRTIDGEEWLHFEVQDTGVGMDAAQVERLFDKFTQADSSNTRRHGGSGLGLTITRELSRLLGGDVTVRSEPGQGSTFTVDLPAVAPEQPEDPAPGSRTLAPV